MHGRLDIAVVGYLHGDLRPLIDVQAGAGDRPVVGEHAQLGAVEALAYRADLQVQRVPIVEPEQPGPDTCGSPAVSVVNRFSASGMVMASSFGRPVWLLRAARVRWLEGRPGPGGLSPQWPAGVVGRLSADLGAGQARDSAGTVRLATVASRGACQARVPCPEMGEAMFSSIGRFCVRRRRFVLAGALLFFVAGIIVGSGVFMHLKESHGSSGTESVQGSDLIDRASGHGPEMVAVVDGPRVGDPAVRQAVLAAAARVAAVRGVTGVVTAYDSPDPMLRAADGRASLIVISTAKTGDMMRTHQEVADVRRVLSGSVPAPR